MRNKIRGRLIPMIETINPNFKSGLFRMGNILRADRDYIVGQAGLVKSSVIEEGRLNLVKVNLKSIRNLPISIQRQLINGLLEEYFDFRKDKSFRLIENIRKVFMGEIPSHYSKLAHDVQVLIEHKIGYLYRDFDDLKSSEDLMLLKDIQPVKVPGKTLLSPQWKLSCEELEARQVASFYKTNPNNFTAFLDAGLIKGEMYLRKWKVGDRYAPLGMAGHSMKLSDFWINKGVPRRYRSDWPLLICGNEIIWIPGFQPAFSVKIKDSTQRVFRLRVEKIK